MGAAGVHHQVNSGTEVSKLWTDQRSREVFFSLCFKWINWVKMQNKILEKCTLL